MVICYATQGAQIGALWQAEGWDGEGDKREETWVFLWLVLVDVRQKTSKFYKAIILQLNFLIKKE